MSAIVKREPRQREQSLIEQQNAVAVNAQTLKELSGRIVDYSSPEVEEMVRKSREFVDKQMTLVDEQGNRQVVQPGETALTLDQAKEYAKQQNAALWGVRKPGELTQRTDLISFRRKQLPDAVQKQLGAHIPLPPHAFREYLFEQQEDTKDIVLFMPLVPLPVKTPKLLLLLTDTPFLTTISSTRLISIYTTIINFIKHHPFLGSAMPRRRDHAFEWLEQLAKKKKDRGGDQRVLPKQWLDEFRSHCVLAADIPRDVKLAFESWEPKDVDIELLRRWVVNVHGARDGYSRPYQKAWNLNKRFKEDVLDSLLTEQLWLTKQFYASFDRYVAAPALNPGQQAKAFDFDPFLQLAYGYTFELLKAYEATIISLLSENLHRSWNYVLLTVPERPSEMEIGPESARQIGIERRFLTATRNVGLVKFPRRFEIDEEGVVERPFGASDAWPTSGELYAHFHFLDYYAKDEQTLRDDTAAMKEEAAYQQKQLVEEVKRLEMQDSPAKLVLEQKPDAEPESTPIEMAVDESQQQPEGTETTHMDETA